MKEIWKWIKGYEKLYQISKYGNVKSFHRSKNGIPISCKNSNGWYLSFRARNSIGKTTTLRVHVEVASVMTGICHRNILQVASRTPFNSKGNIRKQAGGYVWKFADESEVV